jgi:hypothetical protein
MKVITFTAWRRPHYTYMVCNALKRCHGIRNWTVLIHVDGDGHRNVERIAKCFRVSKCEVLTNDAHLGCNANTREALRHGFSLADYVVHIEDDVVLAPDALRYFDWGRQFGGDPTVFTVNAWRHDNGWLPSNSGSPNGSAGTVERIKFFNCWGWATWKDRWQEMDANWSTADDLTRSWDFAVSDIRGERFGLQPHISRATNVGARLGVHRGDARLEYWAGTKGFAEPDAFTLI